MRALLSPSCFASSFNAALMSSRIDRNWWSKWWCSSATLSSTSDISRVTADVIAASTDALPDEICATAATRGTACAGVTRCVTRECKRTPRTIAGRAASVMSRVATSASVV